MTLPVHVVRDSVGICEVLKGRCRQGDVCKLEHATKADAIREIRLRVFADYTYSCYDCGVAGTWDTLQLHELKHRGKHGTVSITNSVPLCMKCHNKRHSSRAPRLDWLE